MNIVTCVYCEMCKSMGVEPIWHDHIIYIKKKKEWACIEDNRKTGTFKNIGSVVKKNHGSL